MNTPPPITALVCTRNRGDRVLVTVEDLLVSDHPDFRILVVDQSTNDDTATALSGHRRAGRIEYYRSSEKGISKARNLGINLARSDLVACTDDDCRVPPDWLTGMAHTLSRDKRFGLVFGNLVAADHDREAGYISAYRRRSEFTARCLQDKPEVEGMGACMGLRKSAWRDVGGFDEGIGYGTDFPLAEETDISFRILNAGYFVHENPALTIEHHGFRTWDIAIAQSLDHTRCYGAIFAKHLKSGNLSVLGVLAAMVRRWLFGKPNVAFARPPAKHAQLKSFAQGFLSAFFRRVDRQTVRFRPHHGLASQKGTSRA